MIRRLFPGDLRRRQRAGLASGLATASRMAAPSPPSPGARPLLLQPLPPIRQRTSPSTRTTSPPTTPSTSPPSNAACPRASISTPATPGPSRSIPAASTPSSPPPPAAPLSRPPPHPFDIAVNRRGNYGISDSEPDPRLQNHLVLRTPLRPRCPLPLRRQPRRRSPPRRLARLRHPYHRLRPPLHGLLRRQLPFRTLSNPPPSAPAAPPISAGAVADPAQGFVFYFDQSRTRPLSSSSRPSIADQQGNTPATSSPATASSTSTPRSRKTSACAKA
jgi:hypothetical protein